MLEQLHQYLLFCISLNLYFRTISIKMSDKRGNASVNTGGEKRRKQDNDR